MADAFFFELPKEQPAKCLSYGFRQGENRIKKPYFYRTVLIRQANTMTGPEFFPAVFLEGCALGRVAV